MPPQPLKGSDQQDKCLYFRFNQLFIDHLCQRPSYSTPVNSEISLNCEDPDQVNLRTLQWFDTKSKTKQSRWWEQHTQMLVSRTNSSTHMPGNSQRTERSGAGGWGGGGRGWLQHCSASASDHLERSVWILRDKVPHQKQTRMREWTKMLKTCWKLFAYISAETQLKQGGWVWGNTSVVQYDDNIDCCHQREMWVIWKPSVLGTGPQGQGNQETP